MIDFHNLSIPRMMMHVIHEKMDTQDTATATYGTDLLTPAANVINLIKTRLVNAAGRNSRAFELEFELIGPGSFYDLSNGLWSMTDAAFVRQNQDIADLLAGSQRRSSIPGGYLLVLDCLDSVSRQKICIVIKAEPHEALQQIPGQRGISFVEKVFLSPSQKLYKIGIVYEKEHPVSTAPNDRWGCFLYDDQFRVTSHPAEYFYKDFLGFSVGKNAKIQSQRFFDKTERFVKDNISDVAQKINTLNALRIEFTTNTAATVSPETFGRTYFTGGTLDQYLDEIIHELPLAIVKDDSLLENKLYKRKIDFPHNINIIGPGEEFDQHVRILSEADLGELDFRHNNFTLVQITGKPYSND